jgi:hypothetical protein
MKQVLPAIVFLFCFCHSIHAQKQQIKFSGINQFGILTGKSDQTYQLQTINGVRYKTWFAGVGAGLEEYYRKTIPVFIDLRRYLFSGKATPFAYADLGFSFPYEKNEEAEWQRSEYKKGLYYDLGVGYSIPLKGSLAFNFSAGYCHKELHESRYYRSFWDFPPYDQSAWNKDADYDFTFRRISIKAALQF